MSGRISDDVTVPYKAGIFIPGVDMTLAPGSRNIKVLASSIASFAQLPGLFDLLDYGAKGDGVADDTAAFNAALAAMPASGGMIWLGPGFTYLVTGTINIAKAHVTLFGPGATITTNNATADLFNVTADYFSLAGPMITASVTRTAGAFVHINNGNYARISDFTMTAFFNGIVVDGAGGGPTQPHISHGRLMQGVPGTSIGIVINSGVDLVLEHLWIVGGAAGANLMNGVLVNACGDLTLDHVSTVYAGTGLSIAVAATKVVQIVSVIDSFFDSGSGAGIYINSAGSVQLVKIEGTWVATNAQGQLIMTTSGSGTVEQVDAINSIFSNSPASANGVVINTTSVTYVSLIGSTVSGNGGVGVLIQPNAIFVKIIGCTIGQSGEFGGNTGFGIVVGGGCTRLTIADNYLSGNTGGSVSISAADLTSPTNFIHHNFNFITANAGVASVPAGTNPSVVVPHGLPYAPTAITLGATSGGFPVFVTNGPTNLTIAANGTVPGPLSVFWRATLGVNA
jgi:hypothetical protein